MAGVCEHLYLPLGGKHQFIGTSWGFNAEGFDPPNDVTAITRTATINHRQRGIDQLFSAFFGGS